MKLFSVLILLIFSTNFYGQLLSLNLNVDEYLFQFQKLTESEQAKEIAFLDYLFLQFDSLNVQKLDKKEIIVQTNYADDQEDSAFVLNSEKYKKALTYYLSQLTFTQEIIQNKPKLTIDKPSIEFLNEEELYVQNHIQFRFNKSSSNGMLHDEFQSENDSILVDARIPIPADYKKVSLDLQQKKYTQDSILLKHINFNGETVEFVLEKKDFDKILDVRTETNAGNFLKPNAKYVYLKFEIKSAIEENLNQTISTLRKIKSKQEFNSQNIDIHNFKRIFEFNSTYKNTRNIDRNAVVNNFIDILETVAVKLEFTFPTEISNVALYFVESTEFSQESRWILPKK